MKNKKECEIVQDLLVNYADGILNPESKKLVEEHIRDCENCQLELNHIQDDSKEKENKEQIELDYLKKIRIKSKIKSILLAIGIIALIAFIIFLNNFLKINSIMNKADKSLQSNNFYKETTQMLGNNETSVTKEYYKDGKYKSIWMIYSDNGVETKMIEYANSNSDERTYIYETEKKAVIEKGDISEMQNSNIKNVPFVTSRNSLFAKIGTTFVYSIDTDTFDYGKEYYILKNRSENNIWEIWIDKETGLPIREINRGGAKSFFTGTDVVKEVRDTIQTYKYEFDTVTDEEVEVPDLSNYTVENKTLNMEDMIEE